MLRVWKIDNFLRSSVWGECIFIVCVCVCVCNASIMLFCNTHTLIL